MKQKTIKQKYMKSISGKIVDPIKRKIYNGEIFFTDKIIKIVKKEKVKNQYILPGLINSHVHIESSMLSPFEFSKQVIKHGTVAVVTDPHEIANVLGIKGINYMIRNSKLAPLKIYFGAPSCVPATNFESSGSTISSTDIENLFKKNKVHFLSEMMNFPGVIYNDAEVLKKLELAKKYNKKIDGHAPGLIGTNLKKYINSGISTDHECFTLEEAIAKIKLGMFVQIREGSAAKNFNSLFSLIDSHTNKIMLCTDDSHPDDLVNGHINLIFQKALQKKLNYFNVLQTCTINPIKHYELNVGLLQVNDCSDFVVCKDKNYKNIISTYINGLKNYKKLNSNDEKPNNFKLNTTLTINDIKLIPNKKFVNVISVIDGELVTKREKILTSRVINKNNILCSSYNKIVVLNRYSKNSKPIIGIINNYNIKNGAIASTIAHDSHNIIAVGNNDTDIISAINSLIKNKGGIVTSLKNKTDLLPLEIAGIMTNSKAEIVAKKYKQLTNTVINKMGCKLKSPFMTLSFMALLVIPELKIGDKGLFDIRSLEFVNLFEN